MAWWNWIIINPGAMRLVRQIDDRLDSAFVRHAVLPPERKELVSSYMVQFIAEAIPNYDFGRSFYVQWFAFIIGKPPEILKQGVATFADLRNGANEGWDEELEIVTDILACLFALFAVRSRSAYTKKRVGEVFAIRSRTTNDLIQSFIAAKLFEVAGDWVSSQVFHPSPK